MYLQPKPATKLSNFMSSQIIFTAKCHLRWRKRFSKRCHQSALDRNPHDIYSHFVGLKLGLYTLQQCIRVNQCQLGYFVHFLKFKKIHSSQSVHIIYDCFKEFFQFLIRAQSEILAFGILVKQNCVGCMRGTPVCLSIPVLSAMSIHLTLHVW